MTPRNATELEYDIKVKKYVKLFQAHNNKSKSIFACAITGTSYQPPVPIWQFGAVGNSTSVCSKKDGAPKLVICVTKTKNIM